MASEPGTDPGLAVKVNGLAQNRKILSQVLVMLSAHCVNDLHK